MMNNSQWNHLLQEHELAYFRCDLATSSPQSYTIEEMREISQAMDESTAEVDAAIRADFNELPPHAQARMLELLESAEPDNMTFWREVLGVAMPDRPPVIA